MGKETGWGGELALGSAFRGPDFCRLFPGAWAPPTENSGRKLESKRREGPGFFFFFLSLP